MQKYNYSANGKAQIKVLKIKITTELRYFERYDIVNFNFQRATVTTNPIKNEDGTYTIELIPIGKENEISQYDTLEFENTINKNLIED